MSLVLYGVTTLCSGRYEDALQRVSYSKKNGRSIRRWPVGLLVGRQGIPLESAVSSICWGPHHHVIVKQFQERHGLADMVVVADAGMLSTASLTALNDADLRFIVGSRTVKEGPATWPPASTGTVTRSPTGQIIDTITRMPPPRKKTPQAR